MSTINIELYNESLTKLEEVLDQLNLDSTYGWYELEIETDMACPHCDGDIIGEHDCDGWHYRCIVCGIEFERNDNNLEEVS